MQQKATEYSLVKKLGRVCFFLMCFFIMQTVFVESVVAVNQEWVNYWKQKEIMERIDRYRSAKEDAEARNVEMWMNQGNSLAAAGQYRDAAQIYSMIITQYPNNDNVSIALGNRGNMHLRLGNYALAINDYNRSLSLNTDADILINRAIAYSLQKEFSLALNDINLAISLSGTSGRAYYIRGMINSDTEKFDLAITDYSNALSYGSGIDKKEIYIKRGECYRRKGDFAQAIQDFSEALKENPNNSVALAYRGESFRMLKNFDQALSDLNQSIAILPTNLFALASRGEVYRQTSKFDLAISDFDRALELDSNYQWVKDKRQLAIQQKG